MGEEHLGRHAPWSGRWLAAVSDWPGTHVFTAGQLAFERMASVCMALALLMLLTTQQWERLGS